MIRPSLPVFVVVLLSPFLLFAQTTGNWDVVQHFTAGQAIRVSLADGRSFQGKFQSATDGELLLSTSKGQETVPRTNITKVATKGTNHRMRNALIGLGVGAGAGLGAGAIVDHESKCSRPSGCLLNFPNLGKEVLTPVGALLGLIIGALIPNGTWHDVYRTK